MEVVYDKSKEFIVNGLKISLFCEEINGRRQITAGLEDIYYHLGNEILGLSTAIMAYEEFKKVRLTDEELRNTLVANGIV